MENVGTIQFTMPRSKVTEIINNMAQHGYETRWENEALYFYKGDTKITSLYFTWVHGESYMIQYQILFAE